MAGISISMLSGDNGILQRATDAKTKTERQSVIEQARTDVLGYQAENKSGNIEKSQLKSVLEAYFKDVPEELPDGDDLLELELVTLDKYGMHNIKVSEIYNGNFSDNDNMVTLGEKYEDSWIGKKIAYSAGGVSDWIIIGQEQDGDVLITPQNPVGNKTINRTLAEWCNYETNLINDCLEYKGKIGKNNENVKAARNITLDDINYAVGFTIPEEFDTFTFGIEQDYSNKKVNYYYPDENEKIWKEPNTINSWTHKGDGYYYYNDLYYNDYKYGSNKNGYNNSSISLGKPENMKYIVANNNSYWVGSRSMDVYKNIAYYCVAIVKGSENGGNPYIRCDQALCNSKASGGSDDNLRC